MKAFIAVNCLMLVVGVQIGLSAKEPTRFPPRFMFPGELQKVRNTFSIEDVKRAQRLRKEATPLLPPVRPVPIPPPEFDPIPEGAVEEYEPNPVQLLDIEPMEDDGGDAPLFEVMPPPPASNGRPKRPLTDEEWRHSAERKPAFNSEPIKR